MDLLTTLDCRIDIIKILGQVFMWPDEIFPHGDVVLLRTLLELLMQVVC